MNVEIVRKNIKNINLKVKPEGKVVITVPSETTDEYIELVLNKRKPWIDEQLNFFKKNHIVEKEKSYISGDSIKYLGRNYRLKLHFSKREEVVFNRGYVNMYTVFIDDSLYKKKLLDNWYRSKAKEIFNEYIEKYLKVIKEPLNKVNIRYMKTRWGSCNFSKKKINLNLNLIKKSKIGIEYVIFHELVHLKYPNHSKDFYNYLLTHMPDYKWRKDKLEEI